MVALVCFSLASALRCPGLSRIEAITLTIPPALQLLLTLFLVRSALRSNHHKNWLIVLEAFVYLVLVVTDFGIHETVRDSDNTFLNAFIVADKAVGVLSFIPLLLFTLFLFLFSNNNLMPYLPTYIRFIAQFKLVLFIPLLILFNELSSLFGLSYGTINNSMAQGYSSPAVRTTSFALTAVTLLFSTLIQLIVVASCGYLCYHMSQLRQIGGSIPGTDAPSIVWLGVGTFIGAVDSLVGFSEAGFSVVLARRILQFLSRVCIVVALVRYASTSEELPPELGISSAEIGTRNNAPRTKKERKANIRALISNPRFSTFAQLSPRATAFYSVHHGNPFADPPNTADRRRVTVQYDQSGLHPPTLEMRFSALDMPPAERAYVPPTQAGPFRQDSRSREGSGVGSGNSSARSDVQLSMIEVGGRIRPRAANASLYRQRPELFPPSPAAGSEVIPTSASTSSYFDVGSVSVESVVRRSTFNLNKVARAFGYTAEDQELARVRTITNQFPPTPRSTRFISRASSSAELGENPMPVIVANTPSSLRQKSGSIKRKLPPAVSPSLIEAALPGTSNPFADVAKGSPTAITTSRPFIGQRTNFSFPLVAGSDERVANLRSRHPMSATTDGSRDPFEFDDGQDSSQHTPQNELIVDPRSHDMRHRRIPTAELAPLNVFRDRFADQRGRRLSTKSKESSGKSLALSLSSSSEPLPSLPISVGGEVTSPLVTSVSQVGSLRVTPRPSPGMVITPSGLPAHQLEESVGEIGVLLGEKEVFYARNSASVSPGRGGLVRADSETLPVDDGSGAFGVAQ